MQYRLSCRCKGLMNSEMCRQAQTLSLEGKAGGRHGRRGRARQWGSRMTSSTLASLSRGTCLGSWARCW